MFVTHQPSSRTFELFVQVVYSFPGPIANSINKVWFGGGKTLTAPAQCKPIVTQALGEEEHELHSSPFVT